MASQYKTANRWEDWTNLILAAWLFVSPWALQFAPGATAGGTTAGLSAAAWNAWISGVVIAVIAAMALFQLQQWEEWSNAVVGLWVAVSPWVLGFSGLTTATWNAVIAGILVLCLAGWDLYEISATSTGARCACVSKRSASRALPGHTLGRARVAGVIVARQHLAASTDATELQVGRKLFWKLARGSETHVRN